MPTTLNRAAYLSLIVEDLAWLRHQPNTLERRHIECLLEWIIRENQPSTDDLQPLMSEYTSLLMHNEKGWYFHCSKCWLLGDVSKEQAEQIKAGKPVHIACPVYCGRVSLVRTRLLPTTSNLDDE